LINAALDAHHDDPTFGYRFISDELEAQGFMASENRVQRLCSLQRIWSIHAKKRGMNRRPGPQVHDDLVNRDFTATAANVLWLTDITEHRTNEGRLNLCAIKDVFSNRIVGYSMDDRPALPMTLRRAKEPGHVASASCRHRSQGRSRTQTSQQGT
jgi:transposase InsO family protein